MKLFKDKFEFIGRSKAFLNVFKNLGIGLLFLSVVFTMLFFWIFIGIYYGNKFLDLSALMLRLIELSLQIVAFGALGYYFFTFLNDFLIKRGMEKHGKVKKRK